VSAYTYGLAAFMTELGVRCASTLGADDGRVHRCNGRFGHDGFHTALGGGRSIAWTDTEAFVGLL
jgi:hypothetical protein